MAETVYLLDDKVEVLLGNQKDAFEQLLREKLGTDAADTFRDILEEVQAEAKDQETRADEEERVADGYRSLCQETLEALDDIQQMLEEKRLDRKAVKAKVNAAWSNLYGNM